MLQNYTDTLSNITYIWVCILDLPLLGAIRSTAHHIATSSLHALKEKCHRKFVLKQILSQTITSPECQYYIYIYICGYSYTIHFHCAASYTVAECSSEEHFGTVLQLYRNMLVFVCIALRCNDGNMEIQGTYVTVYYTTRMRTYTQSGICCNLTSFPFHSISSLH